MKVSFIPIIVSQQRTFVFPINVTTNNDNDFMCVCCDGEKANL